MDALVRRGREVREGWQILVAITGAFIELLEWVERIITL